MKTKLVSFFMCMLVATAMMASAGYAEEAEPVQLTFLEESQVWVEGTSTVHDWACKDVSYSGQITLDASVVKETKQTVDREGLIASIKNGELKTPGASLTVPVKKMHCEKSGMDPKMYSALQVKKYPEIQYSMTSVSLASEQDTASEALSLNTTGTLSIAGVTKTIEMPVKATLKDDGVMVVEGSKPMKLSQFNIEKPTAMWGMIETYDDITVHFKMLTRPETKPESKQTTEPAK